MPWRLIKDMRNRLTHYYEATDYQVVWDTVTHDLPVIQQHITSILR